MMRSLCAAPPFFVLLLIAGLVAAPTSASGAPPAVALVSPGQNQVEWTPLGDFESIALALADPQGLVLTHRFGPGEAPVISLFDAQGMPLPDGTYTWELRGTPRRSAGLPAAPLSQSGYFTISNGSLIAPDLSEPPEKIMTSEDQIVPDDLIVDGKGCIGLGCANNEPFGAEALRLKQSVIRLRFQDTSTSASFPAGDWQIATNDAGSGGAERFSIEDLTAGTTPVTIRGGAPDNALYVDGQGNLGAGTATPAQDVHVASGSTPTLRLEQNAGTLRTWDVGGNEIGFFVRDVTGGSSLPFRIRAGAPTSSIDVQANGNVGIGTSTPGRSFEVARPGVVDVAFFNTSSIHAGGGLAVPVKWFFQVDNDPNRTFKISREGGGGPVLTVDKRLDANGPTFRVDGSVQATNVVFSSSRDSKEDFQLLDPQEILARTAQLPISEWTFKEGPKVRHIGPMAEDFNAAFGLGTEKTISLTDVSGVALAAIQGLHSLVEEQQKLIGQLEERLRQLESQHPMEN